MIGDRDVPDGWGLGFGRVWTLNVLVVVVLVVLVVLFVLLFCWCW